MKRLLIISFVLLLAGVVFAGPPAIPPKDLIEVSDNCDQPQYYVLGKVCQSSVDGKLYKGDGNQIIELAAGTSEGDMLGAFYASEGRIRPLRGGTGIDSSGLSGFPHVTSGTWSVLNNAGVKSALGYLTSTDYPVTGVAAPTPGMIPKWGVSGNTLVDGYDVAAFQAALTNPVTGAATTTQGMIPVWGATSNTLADGYVATYFQTALTNPVTGVASPTPGYLTKWGESGNSIADGLKLGTLTDGRWCTYTTADGLKCTETKPAGEGGGISLSDIYSGEITDGALPKYNSATDTLSEGLKLGTLTNDKWCKYTTEGGLVCTSDEPSGGSMTYPSIGIPVSTGSAWGDAATYSTITGLWGSGSCSGYLKSDGTCDTPSGGGGFDATGAIVACTNLKDEDLAEIEGSADDIGVKVETISVDPEEVIECEGKDRNYIVGFNEPSFFQLPADPTGVRYCFGNNDYAKVISIVPDGTDTITHGGTATASGQGLVSTGSEEDWICLLGLSSSKWRTISYLGTWSLAAVELPDEPEPPVGDCTTPTGNLLTESFGEGTTLCWSGGPTICNNTWTVASGTPSIVDMPVGAPDNTACGKGIYFSTSSSVETVRYSLTPSSVPLNRNVTLNFSIYVSSSSMAGFTMAPIVTINDHSGGPHLGDVLAYIALRRSESGDGPITAIRADMSTACEVEISEDAWYNVTVTIDGAGAANGSILSVANVNSCNFTRDSNSEDQTYVWAGVGGNKTVEYYLGNLNVSVAGE